MERTHQGDPGGFLELMDLTLFTSTTPFLQLVLSRKINDPWVQAQWVVSINLAELGDVSGCILKGHALLSRSLTCQLSFVYGILHIDPSWHNMSSIACCPIVQHVTDGNTLSWLGSRGKKRACRGSQGKGDIICLMNTALFANWTREPPFTWDCCQQLKAESCGPTFLPC